MIGVAAILCCAHRDPLRPRVGLHGHTYQVVAWFRAGDAVALQDRLTRVVGVLDHKTMPPELARAEDIAQLLVGVLGAEDVEVNRPLEGIYAKVRPCGRFL